MVHAPPLVRLHIAMAVPVYTVEVHSLVYRFVVAMTFESKLLHACVRASVWDE